jgi:SAM-dependent methyltransferase
LTPQQVNFIRRMLSFLPPPLRRATTGLWLDLGSLPARLRDPERRSDPWQTIHNVGAGDFRMSGKIIMDDLIAYGGLAPDDQVLDIGCGVGRVAMPLAEFLSPVGGYVGFDISPGPVKGCRRRFAKLRPDFRFEWLDVRNGDYNASGAIAETEVRFPCEDASIDLAFATSVFSHVRIETIRRYLAEAERVLKPGGRIVFTAYALTPERRDVIRQGWSRQPFVAWEGSAEGSAMVVDPRSPERAIAHDAAALDAAIASAGLRRDAPWRRGVWTLFPQMPSWQDLWVAQKP